MTNYIPIDDDANSIHVKGLDILSDLPSEVNYGRIYCYNGDKTYNGYIQPSVFSECFTSAEYDSSVIVADWQALLSANKNRKGTAFIRFGGIPTADDIIVTVDENIQ